jgi:beta-N-acetylhexosaminidase
MMRLVRATILALVLLWPFAARAQPPRSPRFDDAAGLLERMSPEERVGQLFVVSFKGSAPPPDDPIFDLIQNFHISGVMVDYGNDNFAAGPDTLAGLRTLAINLQTAAFQAAQPKDADVTGRAYVPLFIGVDTSTEGMPLGAILDGAGEVAPAMAIGATWDAGLARSAGAALGTTLESLGLNLMIGPSLDILTDPSLSTANGVGVQSFGGDGYWVSQVGQAFVEGVHAGSRERVAVIPDHFPGVGGGDRPVEEDVATVRRSLDQLKESELIPFEGVAAGAPGESGSLADGFLTANLRYEGFQGAVRATTKPIGLDRESLDQLMSLQALSHWRQGGGLLVSDSIGSRAIRRFVDPLGQTFNAHLVARDAFLAGNDLLLLTNARSSGDRDEVTTVKATLAFFAQKYREDAVFAQRVDQAVLRILQLKLRLYGGAFDADSVAPVGTIDQALQTDGEVTFQVARQSATLVSPSLAEIQDRLGGVPQLGQRIVFFSDVRLNAPCSGCAAVAEIDVRALERTILELYGSRAAGQVHSWNLVSYTLADLAVCLGEAGPAAPVVAIAPAEDVGKALQAADWLVFAVQNDSPAVYGSGALKLLLSRRPDLARDKRVVVFSFDAPYDLDATDISQVDAFYVLYGYSKSFVNMAARVLFQELPAPGAPPISVPGSGYDLTGALAPAAHQVITLFVRGQAAVAGLSPVPGGFRIGDTIEIDTGGIVDTNGHPVPDGTPVDFVFSYPGELASTLTAATANGSARASLTLNRLGLLTVSVRSGAATSSDIIQLNVQQDVPAFVTVIAPTAAPTLAAQASGSPTTATTTEAPSAGPAGGPAGGVGPWELFFGLVGVAGVGSAGYAAALRQRDAEKLRVRFALACIVGALLGYDYLALGLPGAAPMVIAFGAVAGLVVTLLGGVVGFGAAEAWFFLELRLPNAAK